MKKFQLLKQTFPISQEDRKCDGYDYIMKHTSKEERRKFNISKEKLQKIIRKGEKYLYRVGKEEGKFKTMHISLPNFEIIRKNYFKSSDEE